MAPFDPAQPPVHPLPDPERVELRPGLVYARAGGRDLAMDVYLPADRAPGSRPAAVLLVHGEAGFEAVVAEVDAFVAAAGRRGLPVELVHQPDGHHAFDVVDDTDASRAVIRRVVAFLGHHLVGG